MFSGYPSEAATILGTSQAWYALLCRRPPHARIRYLSDLGNRIRLLLRSEPARNFAGCASDPRCIPGMVAAFWGDAGVAGLDPAGAPPEDRCRGGVRIRAPDSRGAAARVADARSSGDGRVQPSPDCRHSGARTADQSNASHVDAFREYSHYSEAYL